GLPDFQRHERGHRVVERGRVDVRPVAGHHAPGLQPVEPCLHGAAGHTEPPGRLKHPDPRLRREQLDQARVKLVDHGGPLDAGRLCSFPHGSRNRIYKMISAGPNPCASCMDLRMLPSTGRPRRGARTGWREGSRPWRATAGTITPAPRMVSMSPGWTPWSSRWATPVRPPTTTPALSACAASPTVARRRAAGTRPPTC